MGHLVILIVTQVTKIEITIIGTVVVIGLTKIEIILIIGTIIKMMGEEIDSKTSIRDKITKGKSIVLLPSQLLLLSFKFWAP
jgi:hypothetical protein